MTGPDPLDDDPLEPPADADPDFADVEAPPLEPTDVAKADALVFAREAGLA